MNGTRILASLAAVCLMAAALPRPSPRPALDVSAESCLTLSDTPPGPGPSVMAALERCHALLPADVELMGDLGAAYESAGLRDRAEAIYARALAADPGYAELRLRLGRLLLGRGARAEARRQAEAALLTQPNRKAIRDLLQAASGPGPEVPE